MTNAIRFPMIYLSAVALLGLIACGLPNRDAVKQSSEKTIFLVEQGLIETLVEENRLHGPPFLGSNRLSTGWTPADNGQGLVPVPPRAGLEIANLSSRERTLHLRFANLPPASDPVEIFAGDFRLATKALETEIDFSLPPGLAPHSHTLHLAFGSGERPTLTSATLSPALQAGTVSRLDRSLEQTGSSAIQIRHRSPQDGRLILDFSPPTTLGEGQVFEAWLEEKAQGRRLLMRADSADSTARRVEATVAQGAFELSLLALGDGPPGRWMEPRLVVPEEAFRDSEPAPLPEEDPPRLVLVYVLDALRADALEELEQRGEAPFITRLGRQARSFAHHHSTAPNTLPSTAALFYGRLFDKVLEPNDVNVQKATPLAESFRKAGYKTALFSSNVYVTGEFYMDRGFDYVAPRIDSAVVGENLASQQVTDAALDWLEQQDQTRDLFLYLHVINPHNPYTPPARFQSRQPVELIADTPLLVDIREGRRTANAQQAELIREAYVDSVDYADHVLESFVAELLERYDTRQLALAITSDHGEELLEHGGILHGHSLYQEALRIPLVLWPRERFGSGVTERATTTLDLHRILNEVAVRGQSPGRIRNHSLQDLVVSSAASVPRGMFSVTDGTWKVILTGTRSTAWGMGYGPARSWDTEYLFQLRQDPGERHNVLGAGDLEARWLRAFARQLAANQGSAGAPGEVFTDFSAETAEKLRSLGYL